MGKIKQTYIDYLNKHPEIDPYDQDSLREAHIMRNRYTRQLDQPTKARTTQEWREDLALLLVFILIAIIVVI